MGTIFVHLSIYVLYDEIAFLIVKKFVLQRQKDIKAKTCEAEEFLQTSVFKFDLFEPRKNYYKLNATLIKEDLLNPIYLVLHLIHGGLKRNGTFSIRTRKINID